MTKAVEEVRRDMWGQEYRTSSADCTAALDAYYAATMAFGRGRGASVLRAAAADPACVLAAALAAHFVAPRDPAAAAAYLAAAADNLVSLLVDSLAASAWSLSRTARSRLSALICGAYRGKRRTTRGRCSGRTPRWWARRRTTSSRSSATSRFPWTRTESRFWEL
jgi:hypothetical protein